MTPLEKLEKWRAIHPTRMYGLNSPVGEYLFWDLSLTANDRILEDSGKDLEQLVDNMIEHWNQVK